MIKPLPMFELREWGTIDPAGRWVRHHYDVHKPIGELGGVALEDAPLFGSIQHYLRRPQPGERDSYHLADFIIDIDFEGNIPKAIETAKTLTDYLDVIDAYYELYFSGSKGFHVEIPWQVLGAMPSVYLNPVTYKSVARHLMGKLDIELCLAIYSRRRLFREYNTPHQGTGLYKIRLHTQDLELPAADLLQLAETPQLWMDPSSASGAIKEVRRAEALHQIYQDVLKYEDVDSSISRVKNTSVYPVITHPPCINMTLEQGPPIQGVRHKMQMNLASYWVSTAGDPQELMDWAASVPGVSDTPEDERVQDMGNTLRWMQQVRLGFRCGYMQEIGFCDTNCPFYNPQNTRLAQ